MMYKTLEDLRHEFELSSKAKEFKLKFHEYTILYRYVEGLKGLDINEGLFISSSTIYRRKQKIIKKLKAKSFEHALVVAGRLFLE